MSIPRSAGVLLHPTCLPGGLGIGDLGAAARRFVDCLQAAGQSWWQVLPLNPPDFSGSPYSSPSSMAGSIQLVDLDDLVARGWLDETAIDRTAPVDEGNVDFARATQVKDDALRAAFAASRWDRAELDEFCAREAGWLDEWTLFATLKHAHGGAPWYEWPAELVRRDPDALAAAQTEHADELAYQAFAQWVFDLQWKALRAYAGQRGVQVIGDAPIFVAMDSVDVWANRELFKVSEDGRATVVAGVPPDYFSPTGQKWGNPVYDWEVHARTDYAWWRRRLRRLLSLVTIARIDHFRGFESYWEVPADAPTAETGEWVEGPGDAFFDWVAANFDGAPFIAEDLGIITDGVRELRDRHGLPGMKVMQFAFDGNPDHPFLPHTYPENCVAYTGTHDNDTTLGWFESTGEINRHYCREYLAHPDEGIVWALIEAVLGSEANLAVIPVQDLFELGTEGRLNLPGTSGGNWTWRMPESFFEADEVWERLGDLTELFGR